MARRLERLQPHASELDGIAVVEGNKWVLGLCRSTQVDLRADAIAKLEVTGDEIRMEVREEDVLDLEAMLGGKRQVLIDVTLRIDDRCRVRFLVANQVRRVREAIEVKLLQNHRSVLRGRNVNRDSLATC